MNEIDSCKIINCPNECGDMFHKCKEEDHMEICMNVIVKCLYSSSGCTKNIQKSYLLNHLQTHQKGKLYDYWFNSIL